MSRSAPRRLLTAGLVTAVSDGLFSSILSAFFYGSTVTRLWQGVASTVIGKQAFDGGSKTAFLGVAMHVVVAFTWSAVFLLLTRLWPWLERTIRSFAGMIGIAFVYGPLIWVVMSLLVIPFLLHRPATFNIRWWIQFVGHALFVGLPIVASIRSGSD